MSAQAVKQLICRVLIAAVVFAQTAVAAYGCSRLPGTPTALQLHAAAIAAEHPDSVTENASPAPDGGDAGTDHLVTGLCVAHCQFGNQSADHPPTPAAPPALLTILYALKPFAHASESRAARPAWPAQGPPAAADPPHAILHCCLRD